MSEKSFVREIEMKEKLGLVFINVLKEDKKSKRRKFNTIKADLLFHSSPRTRKKKEEILNEFERFLRIFEA